MARRSTGSLVLGAVLVTAAVYAGYRYLEKDKKRGIRVGTSPYGVDYANDADARSDKRPSARLLLIKPYQIFNPGGMTRPFEIDAQGTPTGRPLVLPGEQAVPGGVVVSGQSGPAIVGGQSGPALVGGQSGPALVGGQSGPALVGAWGHGGGGFGHGGFGHGGFGHGGFGHGGFGHGGFGHGGGQGGYGHPWHHHHPHFPQQQQEPESDPMMDPMAPQM